MILLVHKNNQSLIHTFFIQTKSSKQQKQKAMSGKRPRIGAKVNRMLQNRNERKFSANLEDSESNASSQIKEHRHSIERVQEQLKHKRKVSSFTGGIDTKREHRLKSFINFGNWPASKPIP